MMKKLSACVLALFLLASPALAAVGTVFVDTGGSSSNSGTSDANAAPFSGTGANWTTGTSTINLDANTNLVALAVDGSQAIFLTNATNSNQKIFWVTGITGCTGSGACSVTTSIAVTCTTCTAQNWAIGGRYLLPGGATVEAVIAGALRPGDTVQFNNSPATKTVTCFTSRVAGDSTTGRVTIKGKSGVRPVLTCNSASAAVNLNSIAGQFVDNLEISNSGGSGFGSVTASIINNVKVSLAGGSGNCITVNGTGVAVTNSELTGCAVDGINSSSTFNAIGNNIHDLTGDCIEHTGPNPVAAILNNILANCGGRGILLSGTSTVLSAMSVISGNTIYGNTLAGIEITNAFTVVSMRNNIVMNTNSADIVKWAAGNAQLVSQHGYNDYFSSSTGVLNGLTANSTEATTNPKFVSAGTTNYQLSDNTSPAWMTGFPGSPSTFLGNSNAANLSMGAFIPSGNAPSAGGGAHIIGNGF